VKILSKIGEKPGHVTNLERISYRSRLGQLAGRKDWSL
jgi:hypothetical protein